MKSTISLVLLLVGTALSLPLDLPIIGGVGGVIPGVGGVIPGVGGGIPGVGGVVSGVGGVIPGVGGVGGGLNPLGAIGSVINPVVAGKVGAANEVGAGIGDLLNGNLGGTVDRAGNAIHSMVSGDVLGAKNLLGTATGILGTGLGLLG